MSPTQQATRTVDVDPYFDNTRTELVTGAKSLPGGKSSKVPYHVGNTYKQPNGDRQDYLKHTAELTAMQKHIVFFDGDCDGILWPTDSFFGFLSLGFGIVISLLATLIIHGPFSYPTIPKRGNRLLNWLPDPFMRIWIANIHRCKHGSDSESYDRRGKLQKSKFEQILEDYSSAHDRDSLSFKDGCTMLYERRNLMDFFGIFAFIFEWGSSYMLLWPSDGYMKKDDILGILDGSTFVVIAHRIKQGKKVGAFRSKHKVT